MCLTAISAVILHDDVGKLFAFRAVCIHIRAGKRQVCLQRQSSAKVTRQRKQFLCIPLRTPPSRRFRPAWPALYSALTARSAPAASNRPYSSRAAYMAAPIARSKCFMGTPSQTPRHTPEPIVVNIVPRVFWKINRFFQDFLLSDARIWHVPKHNFQIL
jgi:hypothetical protein